jgi:pimeloyl-ACP methyl ester carboxylesterase
MSMQPSFLETPSRRRLAYHLHEGNAPCVLFLGGFKSDMQGGKALALEAFCKARGQRFIRFDYSGHGQSSGQFTEGTIGAWKDDALAVLDALGSAQNLLVGSSMGGWLALLLALARPGKIAGIVTIAAAPDFTERRIWQASSEEARRQLMQEGIYYAPSCYGEEPYPITRALVEEGRKHLLLGGAIDVRLPVRLLHGRLDDDVPWQTSAELMEKLASDDVELHVVKGAVHRMSEPNNLQLLCDTLEGLLSRHS